MKKTTIIIILALFAAACTRNEEEVRRPEIINDPANASSCIRGEIVLKVDDNLAAKLEAAANAENDSPKVLSAIMEELGVSSMERLFPDAGKYEQRSRERGLHKYYIVRFDESTAPTKALNAFLGTKGVVGAELPRKIVQRSAIPNDPYFKWQWDLYNDLSLNLTIKYRSRTVSSNKGCSVNVMDVWENFGCGESDVIVAVVDGGVDMNHPDLQGNLIAGGPEGSRNFVNKSYNVTADSHGTHVAGTIAAVRNNGIGVAGIAGGDYAAGMPGVKILSCQIFDGSKGASDANTAAAIKWGADHGAVISQNSWGFSPDDNEDGEVSAEELREYKKTVIPDYIKDAIDYFIDNAGDYPGSPMKGGLVLFAAGNDAVDYDPICAYEPVVAVGASGPDWMAAEYSNYGPWVDIAAPGGDGYGDDPSDPTPGLTMNLDEKGYSRGNIFNLYQTTRSRDYDYTSYGYMQGTSMACPHVSGVAALLVSILGNDSFTNTELRQILLEGANRSHLDNSYPIGPAVDAAASLRLRLPSTTVAPDAVTDCSFTAKRNILEASFNIPADPEAGKAFGLLCLIGTDRNKLAQSTPENIADGVETHRIIFRGNKAGDPFSIDLGTHKYSTTYYLKTYSFNVSRNWSDASNIISVTTPENEAPVLIENPGRKILYDDLTSTTFALGKMVSDPDGDEITFSAASSEKGIVTASISGTSLTIKSVAKGSAVVTVTADDGDKTLEFSIPVLVKGDRNAPAETSPNPVSSQLSIITEEDAKTHVHITTSSGKTVYEVTKTFSGFDPMNVNMSAMAPGRYGLVVTYNGKTYRKIIVKI